jgi:membrane associated rhomboid family serine protease
MNLNQKVDSVVSFMQGLSWAVVIVGAYLFFTLFYPFGLIIALIGAFFGASFGLWMVVFFEMAHTKQQMHKEKIKHTRLLEKILEELQKR